MENLSTIAVSALTGAAVAFVMDKYVLATPPKAQPATQSQATKKPQPRRNTGPVDAVTVNSITLNNIPKMDLASLSDPYVIISQTDGTTFKTYHLNNVDNATFVVKMIVVTGKDEELTFNVLDSNIGSDSLIGSFSIKLASVWDQLVKKGSHKATGKLTGAPGCSYTVSLLYTKWQSDFVNPNAPTDMALDVRNRIIWEAVKATRDEAAASAKSASQLLPPQPKKSLSFQKGSADILIPTDDDQVPVSGAVKRYVAERLINTKIKDVDTPLPSRSQAINYISETMQPYLPVPVDGYEDRMTDDALSRVFFQGVAAATVSRTDKGFVADFDILNNYEVRGSYVKPHGVVHFDENCKVTHIDALGKTIKPGDADWDHAKFIVRSAATLLVTVREHLIWGHLIWANHASIGCSQFLSADHPFRALLHPHTFRTNNINDTANYTLVTERGLLARETAWTKPVLNQIFHDVKGLFKYELYQDRLVRQNIIDNKSSLFIQDSLEYYAIIQKYVKNYLALYYSNDADVAKDAELQEFWSFLEKNIPNGMPKLNHKVLGEYATEFIFQVTGYHFHNGHVISYTSDPSYRTGKILPGATMASREAFEVPIMVSLSTDMEMPRLVQDWHHLLPANAQSVYEELQSDLASFGAKVEKRNASISHPFETFNPKYHHIPVSV